MTQKHWLIVAGFVAALGTQVGMMAGWQEVAQPAFVAGVLVQLGTFIAALFADKPGAER